MWRRSRRGISLCRFGTADVPKGNDQPPRLPSVTGLIPRETLESEQPELPDNATISRMRGTPYGLFRVPALLSPLELPCTKTPWGALLAVDTATGEVKWDVPLGTVQDLAPVPLPIRWGTPNLGGPMVTDGGLVFIGAAMDNYLRAFDVETGRELWKDGSQPVARPRP